jgi:excisionase family DNA binding protein
VSAGKLLVITEAAAMLGVHQNTLRRWANAGKVPYIRLPSGQRRWTVEQIDQIKRTMLIEEAGALDAADMPRP